MKLIGSKIEIVWKKKFMKRSKRNFRGTEKEFTKQGKECAKRGEGNVHSLLEVDLRT